VDSRAEVVVNIGFSGTRMLSAIGLALGLIAAGFGFDRQARAFPEYRLAAIKQLRLTPDPKDGPEVVQCTYCHLKPEGGDPWNAFGTRVQSRVSMVANINQAIYDVLAEMKDADGDGYIDVLEVFAGTLPGDKTSRPLTDVAYLKQVFDKAGGLEQYKP
jgi:hypothetical protein